MAKLKQTLRSFRQTLTSRRFFFFPLFGKIVVRRDWPSIIPLIPNCKPIFSSMLQENCTEVIFSSDPPFKRLDHYKLHEYTRKWNFSSANKEPVTMTLTTSIDAMFKRKRGRPPKNRVIEVRNTFCFEIEGISFWKQHFYWMFLRQNKTWLTISSPREQRIFVCVEKCRN